MWPQSFSSMFTPSVPLRVSSYSSCYPSIRSAPTFLVMISNEGERFGFEEEGIYFLSPQCFLLHFTLDGGSVALSAVLLPPPEDRQHHGGPMPDCFHLSYSMFRTSPFWASPCGFFHGLQAMESVGCLDDIIGALIHVRCCCCRKDYTDRAGKGLLQRFDE